MTVTAVSPTDPDPRRRRRPNRYGCATVLAAAALLTALIGVLVVKACSQPTAPAAPPLPPAPAPRQLP